MVGRERVGGLCGDSLRRTESIWGLFTALGDLGNSYVWVWG